MYFTDFDPKKSVTSMTPPVTQPPLATALSPAP